MVATARFKICLALHHAAQTSQLIPLTSQIWEEGKQLYLGGFDTEEEVCVRVCEREKERALMCSVVCDDCHVWKASEH